jgi:hypothetical protein
LGGLLLLLHSVEWRWPSGRRQQRWWGGPRLHRIRGRV